MQGMNSVWGSDHLERSQVWSTMLKEAFQDDVQGQRFVNWLTDFPDGAQFNISSVGELPIDQAQEGQPLPTRRPDTGQFQLQITESPGLKVSYTDDFMEDDFLAPQVVNATPDKMKRAMDIDLETKIFQRHREQTVGDPNNIFGRAHRIAGGNSGRIELEDFAYAKLALRKAHVPLTNLVAIVPPEVAYYVETLQNIVNVSNNPHWEGIISSGFTDSTGLRFIRNIYGFDIYESNYLDEVTDETIATKTGDNETFTGGDPATACMFFSALGGDASPFVGAWRREPSIRSWRDENERTEYYQLTGRYAIRLYRQENLVTVLSNTDI